MRVFFLSVFISSLAYAEISVTSKHNWTKLSVTEGVTLFEAEVSGKDVVAFRGDTIIDAPIERLISAFGDQTRKPDWMQDLKEVVTVQKFGKTKQIEYY